MFLVFWSFYSAVGLSAFRLTLSCGRSTFNVGLLGLGFCDRFVVGLLAFGFWHSAFDVGL